METQVNQGHVKLQLQDKETPYARNYLLVEVLFQYPLLFDIEHDPAIVMQEMEMLWKTINKRFIDKEAMHEIQHICEQYLVLAARLVTVAKQFEATLRQQKEEHADKIKENLTKYGSRDPELPT